MTERKKYNINGKKFYLKESLTARDKINNAEIFKKMNFSENTFSVEDSSRSEINKFLKTILIPVDNVPVESEDFFSDTDELVELQIGADFFLQRLNVGESVQNYLISSMNAAKKSMIN